MNKLLFLGTIVLSSTTSCSNSNQSNNADKSTNQSLATNDTGNKTMITQKITPSLWVETTDAKAVVDYYWSALTANGGQESACGWCKDKYGLSWQVVPVEYFDLINSDDPNVREKAMKNTFSQKKIILSELK